MLVDIHTHLDLSPNGNLLRFRVGIHSIGIHPWELLETISFNDFKNKFDHFKKNLSSNILGIGECGLDQKRAGLISIDLQLEVLKWHLELAIKTKRPAIVHCVGAHSDLLHLLKIMNFSGKLLLHDYSGNLEMAQHYLRYDCYFSFGSRLFNPQSKSAEVMSLLPERSIFLETDDQSDFSIADIYEQAESILQTSTGNLEKILSENLLSFFADLDNISTSDLINNLST